MLSSTLITDAARLAALHPAWEDLLARTADNELNLHPIWLCSWWRVFGSAGQRELRVLAFFDDGELFGMQPLLMRPHLSPPGIPFRRLEMLGSGEDPADETCADYLGFIAKSGREAEIAAAVADALVTSLVGPWDELVVSSLNGESRLPALLEAALNARGMSPVLEEYATSPYIVLPATWDAYLASLSRSKRGRLRKAQRVFESWAEGPPQVTRVKTVGQLSEGKRILVALHRERWGNDGVFGSAKFGAFHDRLMRDLMERDELELGWMSVRDEPVAAFYNFRHDGRVYFYQSGRSLRVPDDVRIGLVMHMHLIRNSIEDGMREYDFLAGTTQLKQSFASASRPVLKLRVAPDSFRERVRSGSERGLDLAKELRTWAQRETVRSGPRLRPLLEKLLGKPDP